jgi:REP-associated tyrosine transposase
MPRRARMKAEGFPVHVWQRGHSKGPCFADDNDRLLYLALMREASAVYPLAVHAYVLMTNHIHLLASPDPPESLSRVMKRVNERYARHFNVKYGRTGAVWDGRFKSSIVDSESYLLVCHRYVELNPVRAGMVGHPIDYEWSSYMANAFGQRDDLVTPHGLYLAMGNGDDARRHAYRRFVAAGSSYSELSAIRDAVRNNSPLASPAFLLTLPEELRVVPRGPGRPKEAHEPVHGFARNRVRPGFADARARRSATRETGYVPVFRRSTAPAGSRPAGK